MTNDELLRMKEGPNIDLESVDRMVDSFLELRHQNKALAARLAEAERLLRQAAPMQWKHDSEYGAWRKEIDAFLTPDSAAVCDHLFDYTEKCVKCGKPDPVKVVCAPYSVCAAHPNMPIPCPACEINKRIDAEFIHIHEWKVSQDGKRGDCSCGQFWIA